ncbi:hypothetical protein PT285_11060 [Lactobacillus sp. ESL0791]|uniref:hypothetical protein n=1 Tax=Lactobacillus sp. ESL0791 TaxID=2983234 RepID=UPI0023F85E5B|nr:hypothetical protein [Lactobacillus sp. ESL0791]MDF7639940.1 hypothetical protein [Lactobacillus sp. ESL0791]
MTKTVVHRIPIELHKPQVINFSDGSNLHFTFVERRDKNGNELTGKSDMELISIDKHTNHNFLDLYNNNQVMTIKNTGDKLKVDDDCLEFYPVKKDKREIDVPFIEYDLNPKVYLSDGTFFVFSAVPIDDDEKNGGTVEEIVVSDTDNPQLLKMKKRGEAWHINSIGDKIEAGGNILHFYYESPNF